MLRHKDCVDHRKVYGRAIVDLGCRKHRYFQQSAAGSQCASQPTTNYLSYKDSVAFYKRSLCTYPVAACLPASEDLHLISTYNLFLYLTFNRRTFPTVADATGRPTPKSSQLNSNKTQIL